MDLALPGRIQIAGVIDQDDADRIVSAGADMLGFPLGLKDGHADLSVEEAAAIVRKTSSAATSVCITYLDKATDIAALCKRLGIQWAQLHGPIDVSEIQHLKKMDASFGVIKSLIVRPGAENALVSEVKAFEPIVDAFITDTFDPVTGRSGATGKTHDWEVSRHLVECTDKPVILAGGLTPDNVAEAIHEVGPAAVDAHTGVESPDGLKSTQKLTAFINAAKSAFA